MLALGIERGEHVAIWAPNVPEWIFVQLALARIGAVLVTINTTYRAQEAEYALRQGDVTTIFVAGSNFVVSTLLTGIPLIQMIAFDPAKLLELLADEKGTMTFCVPTMLIALLNHPRFVAGEFDLSPLRRIYTGGAPVPVPLMEQVKTRLGADCTIFFGLTESAGAGTMTLDDDSFELKSSTVGIPFPHVDAKIVDPLTREPVGFGQPGELLLRGFCVMRGYYNMPEKTAEAVDVDTWLHTGDLAIMNPRGYLNIVGRIKEMVIRGGENLFPAEIEQFLMRHPAIAEAQVVGVPDPFMGEELAALLRLKTGATIGETEIRDYCRANISRQKVPKYIRFVPAYPMTASGKVKKFELRARLIQELGLGDGARI